MRYDNAFLSCATTKQPQRLIPIGHRAMSANNTQTTLVLGLALFSGSAFADAGIPLIIIGDPVNAMMVVPLWLVPICIVEALILNKKISDPTRSFAGAVIVANLASTAAGLVFLSLFPTMRVSGTIEDLVTLALFLPLFLISIAIEFPVHKLLRKSVNTAALMRAVVLANIGSYLLMSAFLIGRITKSAIVYGRFIVEFTRFGN